MEQKRWHEGRKVRTKNTRLRRSRAAKAGAVLPPLPTDSSESGGKKSGKGLPRAIWSFTVLGLTTAAVMGASWYLGSHQAGNGSGGGARLAPWVVLSDVSAGGLTRTTTDMLARTTTSVMALTRRVTNQ